jgi:hypothetical protein
MKPRGPRNPIPRDADGRPILASLRDFSEAVNKGKDGAEVKLLDAIGKAALKDAWQAAAWLLERRHPERYARPAQRVIHEGGTTNTNVNVDGGQVDLSMMSDADLDQLDALTAKAIGKAKAPKKSPAPPGAPPPDDDEG